MIFILAKITCYEFLFVVVIVFNKLPYRRASFHKRQFVLLAKLYIDPLKTFHCL